MKAITVTLASTLFLSLISCSGIRGPQVPDMPYTKTKSTPTPAASSVNGEPQTISDDRLLPPMNGITPTVTPAASTSAPIPAPVTAPTPASTPRYGSALIPSAPLSSSTTSAGPTVATSGYAPLPQQTSYTAPTSTPAAATAPIPTSSIPVATAVTGDPHRVYNPWNPSQVIRITNPKTGLPFPSGHTLGIPNSDKKFIVP